jgi:hypothetical protein
MAIVQRLGLLTVLTLGVALVLLPACTGGGPSSAIARIGSRNLRCPQSEVETALHRESSKVSEYYVGCDFMYTRVLCDKLHGAEHPTAECHPAKPQPPCFSGGCFKEDPVTFEWELASSGPTL